MIVLIRVPEAGFRLEARQAISLVQYQASFKIEQRCIDVILLNIDTWSLHLQRVIQLNFSL